MRAHVVVVDSDQHCGSTLGLIHPDGVQVDNANWFKPGEHLKHLWTQHENFVDDASRVVAEWRKKGATAHYVCLGDLTDGDHHHTHQIVNKDQGTHIAAARQVLFDGFLRLEFDTIHFVMGTPAHVGVGGGLEKSIGSGIEAAGYPVVRHPRLGTSIWPELSADFGAYRFDFKHHGRAGTREHTRKSYAALYAHDIHAAYQSDGRRPPDVAVRAHNHKLNDSGPDPKNRTRVLSTGCWQYSSEWVKSKAIESRPDFGGWIFVITDEMRGPYDLIVKQCEYHHPNVEEEVWRPTG